MADIRINALATTATTPASDDYLALDGTAQGTRKILATNIANNVTDVILGSSGPSVKSTLSARAPRQGLVFDGTAGATVANVPAFGTGDFTVVGFGFKTSLSRNEQIVGGATYSFGLIAKTDGTLVTDKEGIAANTASTGTFSAGKFTQFVYSKSGTNATYYINGVSAGTTTDNQNYTVAVTDIGNSTVNANSQWNGDLVVYIYNRALSSSEVVALYEAGVPAKVDYATPAATNTAINTSLTADVGSPTVVSATAVTFTATGQRVKTPNFTYSAGTVIKVSGTMASASGGIVAIYLAGTTTNQYITSNGAFSFLINTGTSGTNAVYIDAATGTGAITGLNVVPLGLLLAPDAYQAGGGLSWYDTSGNSATITLPASGVSWNVPSSQKTASGWTYAGNLEITTAAKTFFQSSSQSKFGDASGIITSASGVDTAIGYYSGGNLLFGHTSGSEKARFTSGGNLLLGTTTDDAVGKLQVTGAITLTGFIYQLENQAIRWRSSSGTTRADIYADNTGVLNLRTGATPSSALTLDGSQNATFAGNVLAGGGSSSFRICANTASGDDRDIFAAQIAGASNGFQIKWNHATTTTRIIIANLPTSSSGLAAGTLWNDSGTIKIA